MSSIFSFGANFIWSFCLEQCDVKYCVVLQFTNWKLTLRRTTFKIIHPKSNKYGWQDYNISTVLLPSSRISCITGVGIVKGEVRLDSWYIIGFSNVLLIWSLLLMNLSWDGVTHISSNFHFIWLRCFVVHNKWEN